MRDIFDVVEGMATQVRARNRAAEEAQAKRRKKEAESTAMLRKQKKRRGRQHVNFGYLTRAL